jgi:hypothetical protein
LKYENQSTFFFFYAVGFTYGQNAFKSAAVVQFQNKMNKESLIKSPLTEDRAHLNLWILPCKTFFVTATLVKPKMKTI